MPDTIGAGNVQFVYLAFHDGSKPFLISLLVGEKLPCDRVREVCASRNVLPFKMEACQELDPPCLSSRQCGIGVNKVGVWVVVRYKDDIVGTL